MNKDETTDLFIQMSKDLKSTGEVSRETWMTLLAMEVTEPVDVKMIDAALDEASKRNQND